MTRHNVMTIEELAEYLGLPASRLLGLARAGNLPGEQVGTQWRFHGADIDRWLETAAEGLHSLEQAEGTEAAVGCTESTDIEEFEAFMAPWDLELEQLSGGPFHTRVQYTKLPGILVYEANWLRAARTHGAAPEGLVMIGTNLAWRRGRNFWCGRAVGPWRSACAGPKAEFGHTSPDRSHHTVMVVDRKLLAAAIGEDAVDLVCRRKHLEFSATDGERLAAAMTGVVRTTKLHPELLDDAREVARAQARLLEPLVGRLSQADADDGRESTPLREESVHRAMEVVEQASLPITALELAVAVGASQRTLEHSFRALLGVTPAVYLRRHRLNGARHDLARADAGWTTVTRIALNWGFSHPGRFSASYLALFGELPSQTLKKSPCRPRSSSFEANR